MGIFGRKSWEEKRNDKLDRLRDIRAKEEKRATLRENIMNEELAIEKAKKKGKKSGGGLLGKVGKGLDEFGKFSGSMTDSFERMDRQIGGNLGGFDFGMGPIGGPGAGPKKGKRRKKSSSKSRKITINF